MGDLNDSLFTILVAFTVIVGKSGWFCLLLHTIYNIPLTIPLIVPPISFLKAYILIVLVLKECSMLSVYY